MSQRTRRARPAAAGERGRQLRVRISRGDGALVGALEIEGESGGFARRVLHAEGCRDLSEALALVAALSLDPHASLEKRTAAPTPSAPKPEPVREPSPAPSVPTSRPLVFGLGAQVGIFTAGETGAVPIVRATFDAALPTERLLSPALRLAIARTATAAIDDGAFGGRFTWTVAQLELCPLRLGRRIGARPCVTSSAGVLDAYGTTAPTTQHRVRPWATTGILARFYAELVPRVVLELGGELARPWIREAFFFEPSLHVYEPPAVVGTLETGVSVLFP
jgi:hypothetical protein